MHPPACTGRHNLTRLHRPHFFSNNHTQSQPLHPMTIRPLALILSALALLAACSSTINTAPAGMLADIQTRIAMPDSTLSWLYYKGTDARGHHFEHTRAKLSRTQVYVIPAWSLTLPKTWPLNESSEHWEVVCELDGVWLLQYRQSPAADWNIADPQRFKGCWRLKQG